MRRLAAALFILWLLTAYLLVYSLADARHKAATIERQRFQVLAAESLASEVLEIHNHR